MMICSRDVGTLEQAAADIERATGGHVETIAADLSRHADVVRVAKDAIARLGRLGVLVNNAGAIEGGDFLATLHDGGTANAALINFTEALSDLAVKSRCWSPASRRGR